MCGSGAGGVAHIRGMAAARRINDWCACSVRTHLDILICAPIDKAVDDGPLLHKHGMCPALDVAGGPVFSSKPRWSRTQIDRRPACSGCRRTQALGQVADGPGKVVRSAVEADGGAPDGALHLTSVSAFEPVQRSSATSRGVAHSCCCCCCSSSVEIARVGTRTVL